MERVDILERGERHRGKEFEGVGGHRTTSNGDWFWRKLGGHGKKIQSVQRAFCGVGESWRKQENGT